jgi:hypothetical protein
MGDELEALKKELKDLRETVEKSQGKSVLEKWSPVINGVLLASVGTLATVLYDHRQMKIESLEALDKYRAYVVADDEVLRKFGYKAFRDLGEEAFVIDLIESKSDAAGIKVLTDIVEQGDSQTVQAAESAVNELMVSAVSKEQTSTPVPMLAAKDEFSKQGWAYLGHFQKEQESWKTRYFDFSSDTVPATLIGTVQTVREATGTLNVRSSKPSTTGQFGKITDALEVGSKTKIYEIKEWFSTGYMWAKIGYSD